MIPIENKAFDRADVCAVVVTYHPGREFLKRLSRITPQVGGIVIVDNGSNDKSLAMLREAAVSPVVSLLENGQNLGIASALNSGVRLAIADGYGLSLLLDQDTDVDDDIVPRLLAAYASHPNPARVAAVGSRFRDIGGRPAESLALDSRGEHWQEVESVITSGTLLPLKAYTAIGPFRDEFFIDYVDTEFCLRARAAGYRIVETRVPHMSHTVGAPTRHRMLGNARWTTNHSAERRYYIARNNTVLLREFGTKNGGSWRMKSVVRSFRLCKRIALFERDKAAKMVAVAQGWWDGIRGKMDHGRARALPVARD